MFIPMTPKFEKKVDIQLSPFTVEREEAFLQLGQE
jgi:hypothetical protein